MSKRTSSKSFAVRGALLAAALTLQAGPAAAITYDLVADEVDLTMPDGRVVTMWAYGLDDTTANPPVTVPGPRLVVPAGDSTLTINLRNLLGVATSVVIPGQLKGMAPTTFSDGLGRLRIDSLDAKTAANGGTHIYSWTGLRPGTYLYRSGTHQQVQVQMGLYGAMTHDVTAGEAYPGVPYNVEQVLVYSEIDPVLHDQVADGSYGTAPAMTSTFDHNPIYYLLNGQHRPNVGPIGPGALVVDANVNDRVLLRMLNASYRAQVPMVLNARWDVIAEDGNPYPDPRDQYEVDFAAGTTQDVMLTPTADGTYPIVERRAFSTSEPGGMLGFVSVATALGAPVALDDAFGMSEDGPPLSDNVLTNDTPAGLTVATLVSGPSNGTLTVWGGNGTFTYEPNPDYNGVDSFTYKAVDGALVESNVGTALITVAAVNDAPVAVADGTYLVPSGQTTTLEVILNDSDVDGDTLSVVLDGGQPAGGTVTITGANSDAFDYTPDNGTTTDSFSYHAWDGSAASAPVTVTITVDAANVAPAAEGDSGTTRRNTPVIIDVVANDSDLDGTIAVNTVVITQQPNLGGAAVANGDGTVTYTPKRNFRGAEIFLYTVNDNDGATSNEATVEVNVTR